MMCRVTLSVCLQCVLDRVWQWPFNAFTLDNATGGKLGQYACAGHVSRAGVIPVFGSKG